MTILSSLIIPRITFQRKRLVTGSIPVVGSSSSIMGGSPTSAAAVLSLRLFPPLDDNG